MTRADALRSAVAELVAWGRGRQAWPASAAGLIDIAATGLAALGIASPAPDGEPDAAWVDGFYKAALRLTGADLPANAAARTRTAFTIGQEKAAYHCRVVERAAGGLDRVADAWAGPARGRIGISVAELLAQLSMAFAIHGRVPHCGPVGRALLSGPVDHAGADRFVPARPAYRAAGDRMAEVQLNFGLPIFVDTGDDSVSPDIVRTGWWEPWTDGIVRRSVGRGDVAVNVGANVGYHTLLMASRVEDAGRVFAFEPNPRLIRLLDRSLIWGGLLGMTTLFPFAASDVRGTARFSFDPKLLGGGAMGRSELPDETGQEALRVQRLRSAFLGLDDDDIRALAHARAPTMERYDVATVRIDDTVGRLVPEIHFLLIDAEGAEPRVLQGARDLIRRSRDLAMVVEWSNGPTYTFSEEQRLRAAEAITCLADDGFRFWRIEGDPQDVYARPAVLNPMTAGEVIGMEGYSDLYICRQPPGPR